MNRISEIVAKVSGSVGIAALAAAILLVPHSDLGAATNVTYCVFTCTTGFNGNCYCNGDCTPNPPCGCTPHQTILGGGLVKCECTCPVSIP